MRKNEKITALYERLSRDDFGKDDDQQRESNSISNQKAMLEEFAARQGFTNIVHFTDDGISGTCFDRPGFLAMMKEVEAGNVEYLCIKDMSRMGRDYLKVGQIMEILRQRGVRLIAINDGVDSARGDDDFIISWCVECTTLISAHACRSELTGEIVPHGSDMFRCVLKHGEDSVGMVGSISPSQEIKGS